MTVLRPRKSYLVGLLSFSLLFVWGIDSAVSQSTGKQKSRATKKKPEPEMIEIKFSTRPRMIRAKVIHGKDMLGVTPFVLEIPKDSGFRDVRVVADGFITLNTRFHTFKAHKRAFKMVKTEDAHTMLGYKHLPPDAAVEVLDAGVAAPAPDAQTDSTPKKTEAPLVEEKVDSGVKKKPADKE